MRLPSVLVLSQLVLVGAVSGQGPIVATVAVNQPMVATWWNAPVGTPGALAVQAPGPLPAGSPTFATVETPPFWPSVPGIPDLPRARASTDLQTPNGPLWRVAATLAPGPNDSVGAFADVSMLLTAPPGTVATIRIQAGPGSPTGAAPNQLLQVDVDADGSNEIDWVGGGGAHQELRLFDRVLGSTPLTIRARVLALSVGVPSQVGLQVWVLPWAPQTTPAGSGCAVLGTTPTASGGTLTSNAGLAAYPPALPNRMLDLYACGAGDVGGFLLSDQPTAVPQLSMPPYLSPCATFANVVGFESLPAVEPNHWRAYVPLLPPGLVFYVQHWSATVTAPLHFGSSNRIRVQT